MDYEKLYKEALERAKNLHKDAIDMCDSLRTKMVEIIFPELKESEDEKIRKDILSFAENMLKNNISKAQKDKFKFWISWLEKQGEKPQGKSALEAVKEEPIDNDIKAEIKVEEPKPKRTFKPYDKVLVCDGEECCWDIDLYGRYDETVKYYPYVCLALRKRYCIPYEGNEHLLGVVFDPKHIEGYDE